MITGWPLPYLYVRPIYFLFPLPSSEDILQVFSFNPVLSLGYVSDCHSVRLYTVVSHLSNLASTLGGQERAEEAKGLLVYNSELKSNLMPLPKSPIFGSGLGDVISVSFVAEGGSFHIMTVYSRLCTFVCIQSILLLLCIHYIAPC